jgi:hypothetical protein
VTNHRTAIQRLGPFPNRKARAVCLDCPWKGRERVYDLPAPTPEKDRELSAALVGDAKRHEMGVT